MNTEPTLPNSLEDAQGRNPLEFPFGFYIEDNYAQSAGGSFFWYKTEQEMFWAGCFGNDYILRNKSKELFAANLNLFNEMS